MFFEKILMKMRMKYGEMNLTCCSCGKVGLFAVDASFSTGPDTVQFDNIKITRSGESTPTPGTWTAMNSGTTTNLESVWGGLPTVTSSLLVSWVQSCITTVVHDPMDSGTTNLLTGVWGDSGSDVFAVGYNGTIMHYKGSK